MFELHAAVYIFINYGLGKSMTSHLLSMVSFFSSKDVLWGHCFCVDLRVRLTIKFTVRHLHRLANVVIVPLAN